MRRNLWKQNMCIRYFMLFLIGNVFVKWVNKMIEHISYSRWMCYVSIFIIFFYLCFLGRELGRFYCYYLVCLFLLIKNSNDILTTNFSQLLSLPDVAVRDFNFFHVMLLSEGKCDWWFEEVTGVKCRAVTLFGRKTPLALELKVIPFSCKWNPIFVFNCFHSIVGESWGGGGHVGWGSRWSWGWVNPVLTLGCCRCDLCWKGAIFSLVLLLVWVLEELHLVSVLKEFLRCKLMIHSTFLYLVGLVGCDVVRIFFLKWDFWFGLELIYINVGVIWLLLWKKDMRLLVGFYFWSVCACWFLVFVMCYWVGFFSKWNGWKTQKECIITEIEGGCQ